MFKSVLAAARGWVRDFPGSRHVRGQVPLHLAHVYSIRASLEYWKWQRTRDRRHLESYEAYVKQILENYPQSLYGHLGRAITAFVLHRNVKVAWESVKACRSYPDGIWRYSEAFLYLYEGNLHRARGSYRAAARTPSDQPSVAIESEIFLEEVLGKEPNKIQLLFGLGTINLLAKGDLEAAERYFRRFREADKTNRFGPYHVWAEDELKKARQLAAASVPDRSREPDSRP
jgi:tetratricopeptide (TPR) repeat protein